MAEPTEQVYSSPLFLTEFYSITQGKVWDRTRCFVSAVRLLLEDD